MIAAEAAEALLSILKEHVECADQWEDHFSASIGGRIKGKAEQKEYAWLRDNHTQPLLDRCTEEGFKYGDLLRIIPVAFATTKKERKALLWDLHRWADDKYDLIPF